MSWEDEFAELGDYYPGSSKRIQKNPPPEPAPPPADVGWDAKPRKGSRDGRDYEFFAIRHLAAALGVQPVTVRLWETKGIIPLSGQRSESTFPQKRHRLYTRPQIEGIARIAEQEGILYQARPRIKETNFTLRVLDLFIEIAKLPYNGAVPLNEA